MTGVITAERVRELVDISHHQHLPLGELIEGELHQHEDPAERGLRGEA